jgi:amino acid adenylation domain-containing protein
MSQEAAPDLRNLSPAEKRRLLARLLAQQKNGSRVYPMSYAQQRLWFSDQISPGSPLFNEAACVRVPYAIDVAVLQRTINEIVRRHATLRTTFTVLDNAPVQIVHSRLTIDVPLLNFSGEPPGRGEAQVIAFCREQAQRPFDLRTGPLIRVILFRVSPDDYLLLVMHHIVCDGYSMRVLSDEIAAIYPAYAAGQVSPLPEPELQYTDFALWQRGWLHGAVLEEQLAYWRTQLESAATLAVPTDRPRPPVQTINGARVPIEIDTSLQKSLEALAHSERVTIFMLLLAAVQVLLHRYTSQDDIVVGIPIANRNYRNTERLIGHFVNMLALRVDASGDPPFRDFLQRVRETAVQAYAHQDLPFERIVEELRPERDLSRHPIFQVTFQYVHFDDPAQQAAARMLTEPLLQLATAKFDLRCDLWNTSDGITGYLEYNTDIFEQSTAARMARHLQTVLGGLAISPDTRLSALPLIGEDELRQVLVEWNDTSRVYPRDTRVEALFEQQAKNTPDAVAIIDGAKRLTYAELNRSADALARTLGVNAGYGRRVALFMGRSAEMIVAMMAVLKAGAAYVPIDPGYPDDRVEYLLRDGTPLAVITTPELAPRLPVSELPMIHVDLSELLHLHQEVASFTPSPGSAESAAYVIYTSGSTGQPKGVIVDHRAIVRLVVNTDYLQLTPADRVAHAASCSFDAATFEIWGSLLNGACIVILQKEQVLSAGELAQQLRDHAITTLFLTTELVNQLIEDNPRIFGTLRTLLFGGSAVDPRPIRHMLRAGAPERLLHVYGPTECTTFATCYSVQSVPDDAHTIPIGRPIANTVAFVVDRRGNPVPPGVPGELELGGDGVAWGYLNQPELTAKKFVTRVFPGLRPLRLYRTGDLAKYRANGDLEFLRRSDRQVKIHGFRVEPDEVEHVLSTAAGVQACSVITRQPHSGGRQLVAYVVAREDREAAQFASELRAWLRQRVPEYMVPAHIVFISALPLNRNGKIDVHALPAPDDSATGNSGLPVNDIERRIAEVWAEVLGRETVGVEDNFFDLGGHSILLVRLQGRLRASIAPHVEIVDLFRYPSVRALANALHQLEAKRSIEAEASAHEQEQSAVIPASKGD